MLATLLSDAEDGQDNLASTAQTWGIVLRNLRAISDAGRRPHRKLSKASGSGSIARVWTVVVRSVLPRTLLCRVYRMADVSVLFLVRVRADE